MMVVPTAGLFESSGVRNSIFLGGNYSGKTPIADRAGRRVLGLTMIVIVERQRLRRVPSVKVARSSTGFSRSGTVKAQVDSGCAIGQMPTGAPPSQVLPARLTRNCQVSS